MIRAAHSGWRPVMWGAITLILLAPLVAMRFTREVAWTAFDFAAAAALLTGAGLAYEAATRMPRLARYRALIGVIVVGLVAVIWAEGAIGIV